MGNAEDSRPAGPLLVRGARLLDRPELCDVLVRDGVIARIAAPDEPAESAVEVLDARGGLLSPAFVEPHLHPDKAFTHPLAGRVDSVAVEAARERTERVKRLVGGEDVVARASGAVEQAIAHGVGTMRAQADVDTICGLTWLDAVLEVRRRYADRIDLQVVAFPQHGILADPGAEDLLREALARGADLLGGAPAVERTPEGRDEHLARLFAIAREHDVGLDVHVDFSYDPHERDLERLARATLAAGWEGRVTAIHCCALEAYPDDVAARTIEVVREAGVQVCVCPVGNLYLLGDGARPPGRGIARLSELLAAGVNVAAAGDSLNDMWFRFGRADPAEVALVTCLAARLRTDAEVREAFELVTTRAARYVGAPAAGVCPGAPADLVLFSAATLEDVLRGAPGSRTTIKRGRVVGGTETRCWTRPATGESAQGSA